MNSKRFKSNIARMTCLALSATVAASCLLACGDDADDKRTNESSPLLLATDKLDTVFNPFFYTSGADGDIVSQTQIGMLSSDEDGKLIASWDEPCVSHDFSTVKTGSYENSSGGTDYSNFYTDYYFAIKDNIRFSDGVLLTKDDVLFNIYMYLDPAYTGSNTMYSVKIRGLQEYRTNTRDPQSGSAADTHFNNIASGRYNAIRTWAEDVDTTWDDLNGYDYYYITSSDKPNFSDDDYAIKSDIDKAEGYYRDNLNDMWLIAEGTDIEKEFEKYKDINGKPVFTEVWQVFAYYMGDFVLKTEYDREDNKYYSVTPNLPENIKKDQETLVEYEYQTAFSQKSQASKTYKNALMEAIGLGDFYSYLRTNAQYREATEGERIVKKIDGIEIINDNKIPVSKDSSGNITYRTLKDADGAEKNYDILHITIDGIDPKAIQNFGFTVAPGHYYSTEALWRAAVEDVNDEENFGVSVSNTDFMEKIQQLQLPLGAGPYKASTVNGGSARDKSDFYRNGIVYLERNDYFLLGAPKIKKLRYKEISSAMLYNAVKTGDVDYASPSMKSSDVDSVTVGEDKDNLTFRLAENLGYGYIGISAKYIPNIYIRKAIMSTFDPRSCVAYYGGAAYASVIYRPMSRTLKDYYPTNATAYYEFDETGETAKAYLLQGGCNQDSDGQWYYKGQKLKYTFKIAGDSDDHPAQQLLVDSANILNNKVGMEISVSNDSQALSRLASGLLTVWAAAWSSSSDPDMYQVYHKDSNATSVRAWGYPEIFSSSFVEVAGYNQRQMIENLSVLIQKGRESDIPAERKVQYDQALDLLMDLAVEFPTYQRKVFYVWRKGILDENTMITGDETDPDRKNAVTTYQSPLSRIWEVSYVNQ